MDEEIKKIIEENYRLTQEIHNMTKGIKRYMAFQKILSLIYFLLIVVPLVLSLIYLPPLLNKALGPYEELLNLGVGSSGSQTGGQPESLDYSEVEKLLKLVK